MSPRGLGRRPSASPTSPASGALRVPERAGAGRVLLLGFTVFLLSPELLSLLESTGSSVTVDLCFNFCSQPAGFLLLWADLWLS